MIVRLVKGIASCVANGAAYALILTAIASPALAVPPPGGEGPEIATGALAGALGLLAGGVLIVRDRLRRK